MALEIWTQKTGYDFGTIQERSVVDFQLPITYTNTFDDSTNLTFKVIAGKIPPGLRIQDDHIVGTPFEVARDTEFKFVIRASYGNDIADRTFIMTISGPDAPIWQTASGSLPIGPNQAYYVLDNSYIEFQLIATDVDTTTGQTLKYFIASGDGELPPGLILNDNGIIAGWIKPAISIPKSIGNGYYDTTIFDNIAYDFGLMPSNGFDSYGYDNTTFGLSVASLSPRKLNRNYEFGVTITDGDSEVRRVFRIYVVGDDFFRADNVVTQAGSGTFTADVSYVRAPIWITPSNLGIRRANNYQTFKLDIYDGFDLGPVTYSLDSKNPDNSDSVLPPGMQFDVSTSEVFGVIPYQPAVTKEYKFTITATRFSDKNETAYSKRTFNVKIIGDVESVMTWISPSDLGSIDANIPSMFALSATSSLSDSIVLYVITDGYLPPGLKLTLDGEIIGKVIQYGHGEPGLITIDSETFTLDNGTTTLDRVYTFTVEARDITVYSALSQTFTILVNTPNNKLYSSLVVKPFLKQEQRDLFKSFITNTDIFEHQYIYRPSDPSFGIQTDLKMLVYAGIETRSAAEVVSAVGQNHKPKKFKLGTIKKAQAKIPGTNTLVYEVLYVEVIDPLEIGKKQLPLSIATSGANTSITVDQNNAYYTGPFDTDTKYWKKPDPFLVTVDRSDVIAGDPTTSNRYPSSIHLWRSRIKQLGVTERNYLPLWMRTIQDGQIQELGYTPAITLCYCKPGTADNILLNIKNTTFDINRIDYVIDRYIIDSVTDYYVDKYITFRNDRTTL